jgi:hypothetical protein
MRTILPARPFRGGLPLACALLLGVAGCEGENLWTTLPTGGIGGAGDNTPPQVTFQTPEAGTRIAVGDSVLVRVRVTDNHSLASLELSGHAVQGSAALGTRQQITRFQPKSVIFEGPGAVRDTVISRYLLATPDTAAADTVYLVAVARDSVGNVRRDSVRVTIGGPRVQVLSPTVLSDVRAGGPLRVRISASDPRNRVDALTLQLRQAVNRDTTLVLDPPRSSVDTTITVQIPASATGDLQLRVVARTANNDSASSAPLTFRLLAPMQDRVPPVVSFTYSAAERAELDDSVTVHVSATDSTMVDRVGVSLLPLHRLPTRTDTLTRLMLERPGEEGTFRFSLTQLGVPVPVDTSTLRLEITAFAVDTAGNCAVATIPGTPLSETCRTENGRIYGNRSGARAEILVVRGATVGFDPQTDRIGDIASDGDLVFLSNLSRNQLDVLRVGQPGRIGTVQVGSRPWGLAFNRDRSLLYVANSGGTNISVVVPAEVRAAPASAREAVSQRIQTPNVKLFNVTFQPQRVLPAGTTDSLSVLVPGSVTRHDYSDRPQYIGVTQRGNLIYSTLPTGAAPDGTIRIWHTAERRLEIVTDYAEHRVADRGVLVNADSAFLVPMQPFNQVLICPRPQAPDGSPLPVICWQDYLNLAVDTLAARGYDTRLLNLDITEVGLSDTTFVAVSGDHSTVAFGEGARDNARVMAFEDRVGAPPGSPLTKFGEIRDIVGNTAERVIGLALNSDGSMGVARGREAYYFSRDLRLQGVVTAGSPAGGVDMHPNDPAIRRSFVSGVEPGGLAYIDVIDTFHYRRVSRIFMRDAVTGTIRAVPRSGGGLTLYAVTARGVVAVDVLPRDL